MQRLPISLPTVTGIFFAVVFVIGAAASSAKAQALPELAVAKDLLLPCQEADNDPRDGYISELECMGFIRGFVAGLEQGLEPGAQRLCIPEANRDDQLRRAFVAWVHASFSRRSKMDVGAALRAALEAGFACE